MENGGLSDVIPTLEGSRHRLVVVAGTSTCHLVQVGEPIGHGFFCFPDVS